MPDRDEVAEAVAGHDPRCIRLTDSEFNYSCDCLTWQTIDGLIKFGLVLEELRADSLIEEMGLETDHA